MEEEDQKTKFFCKFCKKACSTGKSLGGHMRCHLDLIAAERKQKLETQSDQETSKKLGSEVDDDRASYGLREKQLKSCCGSDAKLKGKKKKKKNLCDDHEEVEEEEEQDDDHHVCKKCGKVFGSIRAMYGHMKIHSKRSRSSNEGESSSVLPELETICPVRKKRSTIRYNKLSSANPTVSELDEVQDAAISLIMLSMGINTWVDSAAAADDDDDDDDEDDDEHCISWKNLSEIAVSVTECTIIETKKPSVDLFKSSDFADDSEMITVFESKGHECPVCFKVFPSGQALGGHKRAHYSATIEAKVKKENNSADSHEFLDLNLSL